jgi:prophage regulatory protein
MNKNEHSVPRRLLRLNDVLATVGMGRSWVYREVSANRFPRPIKLGGASRWDAAAVDAFIEARLKGTNRES